MSVYIVESYAKNIAIIDAVYATEQQADARAARLEAEAGIDHFAVHCYPFGEFPVYAIEEARGFFRYGIQADIKKFLSDLVRFPSPDHEYCNIHVLDRQWEAPTPGKDSMGLLRHIHVDNAYLDACWKKWRK